MEPAGYLQQQAAVAGPHAPGEMREFPGLGVLFSHILEAELFRLEKGVLLVERCMVQKLAGGHAQCVGYGFYDVGGGVLAALLDVAKVALGDPGFVCQGLQREITVGAKPADGESYVVSESPLRHSCTPESEGCADEKPANRMSCSV